MAVSHHATASSSTLAELLASETWHVMTASSVSVLALRDLERALASGEIDATTPVWTLGMAEWEALGHVANLEDGTQLDPNGALWASTLPRPARVPQSGIWRRPGSDGAPRVGAPARQRWSLRAATVAVLLLLLLAAWRDRAPSAERSEGRVSNMAVGS